MPDVAGVLTSAAGGVRLVSDDTGAGEAVVLLHGWPDTARLWRGVVPGLVDAGYRVLVPDLRGCGRSDRPAGVEDYAMGRLVDDVLGVLDAARVEAAHVVGHDWGAALAWAVALRHPERVRSLGALAVGHPTAFRAAGLDQMLRSLYVLAFRTEGLGEAFVAMEDYALLRRMGHPDAAEVAAGLAAGQLTPHLNWYRANLPADAFVTPPPRLAPLAVRALGVWASGDRGLGEAQMLDSARYCARGFCYVRLEGLGHWFVLEAPDKVTKVLRDFLADEG